MSTRQDLASLTAAPAASRGYTSSTTEFSNTIRDTLTLQFFAFLWAAFTFFHQAKWTWWTRTPIESLQTAAAIFVVFRPSSLSGLLALVCLQLADLAYTMPDISNHSIFALFVNLTIVAAAGLHIFSRPGTPLTHASLLRLFAPVVRFEVLILYFYVVLHKLNVDFFSTFSSCAVNHSLHLSGLAARVVGRDLFPEGELVRIFVIASTILIEAAIPLLLAFRRTRIHGVGLGIAFHYLLGVNIYHDFSGMIFALYILFLPSNFAERAVAWWQASGIRQRLSTTDTRELEDVPTEYGLPGPASLMAGMGAGVTPGGLSGALVGSGMPENQPRRVEDQTRTRAVQRNAVQWFNNVPAGLWGTVIVIGILLLTGNRWPILHPIFFGIWVIYGMTLGLAFASVVYSQRNYFVHDSSQFRTAPVLMLIPLLVVVNGFLPYLGLKTENSFAMFSNLRTEGGRTNHLFIPASFQIFDFQNDLVTIESANLYELEEIAKHRTAVPWLTLRRHVSIASSRGRRDIQVAYTRGGVRTELSNAESHAELSAPLPWWSRKLLIFREVDIGMQQMCRH